MLLNAFVNEYGVWRLISIFTIEGCHTLPAHRILPAQIVLLNPPIFIYLRSASLQRDFDSLVVSNISGGGSTKWHIAAVAGRAQGKSSTRTYTFEVLSCPKAADGR